MFRPQKTVFIAAATLALFGASIALPSQAQVDTNFNPANIIGDQEILAHDSMTEAEIQTFLEAKNSYLATYQVTDDQGNSLLTSRAIYDRAVTNRVSPQFVLVLLQKEQSLIESSGTPTQNRLDWGAGYGCPDGGGCNERWRGLWKQINSATLQFRDYMDNPRLYRFQVGQTYTFTNPYSTLQQGTVEVTIQNRSTAALYNYTPHVYNGNYNFWRIWQRYFTRSYLNGSLLQASGETGVWLIENGYKRPFLSRSALTSRFDISHIQTVSRADLDKYPTGAPIKFAQYSVVRVPTGEIYLLIDNTKRHFADMDAFRKVGIHPEEVIPVDPSEIAAYTDGEIITLTSAYPTGALLQDKATGGIYWVENETKAPLLDRILLATRFKGQRYIQVTEAELVGFPTVGPVLLANGELVKSIDSPVVYVIEDGVRRPIASETAFTRLNYKWTNVVDVSNRLLGLHPEGDAVNVQ